jgi:hypothetical protein
MKTKRKYKLKENVKLLLRDILLLLTVVVISIISVKNNFNKIAKECDKAYGYTCTYYDVRTYQLNK